MRSWLQLTEIDVARYAKVERQQRESQLQEYLADYNHDNVDHAQTQLHVIDGPANETIAQFCEQTAIGLLIIGHSQNPYGPIGLVTSELVGQNRSDMLILPQNNRANFTALPQTRFIDAAPLKQMS